MSRRIKFKEGEWFAVPLRDAGFGVGVVARTPTPYTMHHLYAFFFGPRRVCVPALDEVSTLTASDALLYHFFSGTGLSDGSWPIIGHESEWDRARWPILPMSGHSVRVGEYELVRRIYHDDLRTHDDVTVGEEEFRKLPPDGTSMRGAIESELTRRILAPQTAMNSPLHSLPPSPRHLQMDSSGRLRRGSERLVVTIHCPTGDPAGPYEVLGTNGGRVGEWIRTLSEAQSLAHLEAKKYGATVVLSPLAAQHQE